MTTETGPQTEAVPEAKEKMPRILVEFHPGRWGKVFHIFDNDGRELALPQKEAVKLARAIIRIAKQSKG